MSVNDVLYVLWVIAAMVVNMLISQTMLICSFVTFVGCLIRKSANKLFFIVGTAKLNRKESVKYNKLRGFTRNLKNM